MSWWYHVAPFVLVRLSGSLFEQELVPIVLDPSLFEKSTSLRSWFEIMLQHSSASIDDIYLTPRYNYKPEDSEAFLRGYLKGDIQDARETMSQYNFFLLEMDLDQ